MIEELHNELHEIADLLEHNNFMIEANEARLYAEALADGMHVEREAQDAMGAYEILLNDINVYIWLRVKNK